MLCVKYVRLETSSNLAKEKKRTDCMYEVLTEMVFLTPQFKDINLICYESRNNN